MQHMRKPVVGQTLGFVGIVLLVLLSGVLSAPARAQAAAGDGGQQEAQQSTQPGSAQGAQPASDGWEPVGAFGEEISVDVVNVAVWVTDEHGRPVSGLTRDDFELLEDGAPRDIVNFAAFEGTERPPRAQGVSTPAVDAEIPVPTESAAPAGEATAEETAPSAPLHLVVVVDNWNLRPESRSRVLDSLRQFIASNLAPGDQVAIMVHDRALQLVQGFTDDPRRVAATLERVEKVAPSGIQMRAERKSALSAIEEAYREWSENNSRAEGAPCVEGWGQMENAAIQYAASVEGHVRRSGGALVSVADLLAGLPDGQRLVVYVGDGLAQTPGLELFQYLAELCPDRRSELSFSERDYDMSWLYQQVARHANAGGVTFFPIEAESPAADLGIDSFGPGGQQSPVQKRGHTAPGTPTQGFGGGLGNPTAQGGGGAGGIRNPTFRPSHTAQSLLKQDKDSSLVLIARETGGRSFLNNAGDFTSDFEQLALDLRNYYSLGFNPADPGDGKLHPIEVRLKGDRHYRVRHRTEYQDKPLEARMVERVRGVAQFGGDENPLGVRIEIGEAVPEEVAFRVPVRIWVPLGELTLVPEGEGGEGAVLQGRLLVLMTATTATGELQPVRQKLVPVTVRGGKKGLSGEQLIEVDVELPPGQQSIALAVRDGLGGTTSYLHHEFRVAAGAAEVAEH